MMMIFIMCLMKYVCLSRNSMDSFVQIWAAIITMKRFLSVSEIQTHKSYVNNINRGALKKKIHLLI